MDIRTDSYREIEEYIIRIWCNCYGECPQITFFYDKDIGQWYVDVENDKPMTMWERIKCAWRALRHGYNRYPDIVIDESQVKGLIEALKSALKRHEENKKEKECLE